MHCTIGTEPCRIVFRLRGFVKLIIDITLYYKTGNQKLHTPVIAVGKVIVATAWIRYYFTDSYANGSTAVAILNTQLANWLPCHYRYSPGRFFSRPWRPIARNFEPCKCHDEMHTKNIAPSSIFVIAKVNFAPAN